MNRIRIFLLPVLLLVIACSAYGQMEMPKPAPELKKLDYWVGNWTMEGDTKPGPMGPGGKFTGTDNYKWMDGGFFLEGHETFDSAMGKGTGVAYLGYKGDDKVYTYSSFDSMGEHVSATGTAEGDSWTWGSEEKMGGQTIKTRFSEKILSPTSYTFKLEMQAPSGDWATVMEGKTTKK